MREQFTSIISPIIAICRVKSRFVAHATVPRPVSMRALANRNHDLLEHWVDLDLGEHATLFVGGGDAIYCNGNYPSESDMRNRARLNRP